MKLDIKVVILLLIVALVGFSGGFYTYKVSQRNLETGYIQEKVFKNCTCSEANYTGLVYTKNRTSFAELFQEVKSSVVSIEVKKSSESILSGSQGSGWVYDSEGHIVTNNHVIENSEEITVRFLDGTVLDASIVGTDPYSDLAVLKINTTKELDPLKLGKSRELRVGDPIAALGNPFGLSGSMTKGIVSQKGRLLSGTEGFSIANVIQIDAAINPGNSGGPLLNLKKEVVGVNTAITSKTGTFSGVGFAVPSDTVKRVVKSIIEKGEYKHPWIGIEGMDVTPAIAEAMDLKESKGFLVTNVVEDSPADKAGLEGGDEKKTIDGREIKIGGDVIIGVEGNKVRKINDILTYLERSTEVGEEITLEVIRDGERKKIDLVLGERPKVNN